MNNASSLNITNDSGGSVLLYVSGFNFIGLLLNTLVIVIVCRPNVIPGKIPLTFLLNQLVSEWICCLLRSLSWLTDQEFWVPDNGLGSLICKLMYTRWLYFGTMHASYSNIILLTVERYVMIVHPTLHKKFTPLLNAFVIFLSWSSGFARMIPTYLAADRSGTSCIVVPVEYKAQAIYLLFWSLILPVIAIACLNGRIIYVLKQMADKMNAHTNSAAANPNTVLRQRLQKQMTYSVSIICLAYVVTVSPIAVVHTMMVFGAMEMDLRGPLYVGVTYCSSMFYLINPLVCIFFMESIRRQVIAMVSCQRRNYGTMEQETKSMGTEAQTASTALKKDELVVLAAL